MDNPIIRNGALEIEGRRYESAAFDRLLQAFSVAEISIASAVRQLDEEGGKNFTVAGAAQLLERSIDIELYLDFVEGEAFEFQLTATFPELSLSTLNDWNILPTSPFVIQPLLTGFRDVNIIFDSERTELYFGAIESDTRIEIFNGLALDKIGFEFLRSYTEKTASFDIYATILIGNTSIETKIEIPLGGELAPKCWVLKSCSTISFGSGLKEIIVFLGNVIGASFENVFPQALDSISTFFLDDLQILLDPVTRSIQFLTFRVDSAREIKVGGQLSINKVGLRVNITPAQSGPKISLTLFGSIKIKEDVFLNVRVMLPENLSEDSWTFIMSGSIALDGFKDIDLLPINTPVDSLHLHPGFLKLESLEIMEFEVDFNPMTPAIDNIVFDLLARAECEMIHGLRLADPRISFTVQSPFDQNRSLIGSIDGTIAVGDINFGVEAEKKENGWRFEGATAKNSIPIGAMVSSLGKEFGAEMPEFLNGVELENLSLRFETNTGEGDQSSSSVTFDCKGSFPIHDQKAELSLDVDVRKNGSYTIDLGGELKISTLDFKTRYSKVKEDNFFAAVYSHTKEQASVRLKEIVGGVSSEVARYVPDSLEIDLKYVLFAFEKGADGNKFLLGMDLGVSAELSDLVSNLPLVGKMLPPGQTIGIDDVQILVASKQFDEQLGGKIAGILPDTGDDAGRKMLQNGLKEGLSVSAKMRLGEIERPLELPISGGADKNPATNGTSASNDAPGVTSSDNAKWFSLQKAFGPVHFNRLGVQYKESELYILLDASISVAGLTLSMDGLSVSSPLNKFAPSFHLNGIGIDYARGDDFEIAGAFLRQVIEKGGTKYEEYDGEALLKIKRLALSAIGSYAYYNEHPSLFIYSVLDYPIGGPSFFFVTGLAAGFGYNRALRMPAIDQVAKFPLVARAMTGPSATQKLDRSAFNNALTDINKYIDPSVGDTFLAVGIKFNSFKIIDSFVLLTVSFGNHFEINLLGISNLSAPSNAGAGVQPVAEAQLALKGSFLPDQGFLGIQAQLTSDSYLLSKACHLTGGFAFFSWFAGSEHDGDFVLTLGGYHPHFKVPAHYPTVPRLGFNWQVTPELSLKGDAYFALTASALMAGGHLEANWRSGSIHAWFKLGADFLIAWQPYHYETSAYIDMGVEVTFEAFGTQHISIDVGADLNIWGPEFSGHASIHLAVVSFKVEFGAAASHDPPPIAWDAFKTSFLPPKAEDVCSIAVTGGLIGKNSQDAGDLGVINPKDFSLVTNSIIPSTRAAYYTSETATQPIALNGDPGKIGISPMAIAAGNLTSSHAIKITRDGGIAALDFAYTPIFKKVPAGLWGGSLKPALNGAQFVENALSGFEIRPASKPASAYTSAVNSDNLRDGDPGEDEWREYRWESVNPFAAAQFDTDDDRRTALGTALQNGAGGRNRILAALGFKQEELSRITLSGALADVFLIAPQIER